LPEPEVLAKDRLADERAVIEEAVRAAGDVALAQFRNGVKGWHKPDGTPVSDADFAVNRLLAERLLAARPTYGWLSEETSDELGVRHGALTYLVDPIDGTRAFLSGGDDWCVGVALLARNRPIAAAILQPVTGALYSAAAGLGASVNGRRIHVSSRRELAGAHLIAHAGLRKPERWAVPWPEVRYGMTFAMLLRLCRVADGSFDGMVALGRKSDWDVAAGDLIVGEAGGLVTDLTGAALIYGGPGMSQNGVIAAGPALMQQMIPLGRGLRG
jgi:myo-inositol-1(or 4)-monophosphatase